MGIEVYLNEQPEAVYRRVPAATAWHAYRTPCHTSTRTMIVLSLCAHTYRARYGVEPQTPTCPASENIRSIFSTPITHNIDGILRIHVPAIKRAPAPSEAYCMMVCAGRPHLSERTCKSLSVCTLATLRRHRHGHMPAILLWSPRSFSCI